MADFWDSRHQFQDGLYGWFEGAGDVIAGGVGAGYNYVTSDDDAAMRRYAQYDHGQFVAGSAKANMADGLGGMGRAVGSGIADGVGWAWDGISNLVSGPSGGGGEGGAPASGGYGPTAAGAGGGSPSSTGNGYGPTAGAGGPYDELY